MIIWIRHAEKLYANGKNSNGFLQHDSPIKYDKITEELIYNLVENLVLKFGLPDKIICSPFLRTRQTSSIINNILFKKYNINLEVEISTDIGEFLGYCKCPDRNAIADIDLDTRRYYDKDVRLNETIDQVKYRAKKHISKIIEDTGKNIWIITHGILISKICEILYNDEKFYPGTLGYMTYKN